MKAKLIILLILLSRLLTCAAFGQSSFELRNSHPPLVDAPVFDASSVPLAGTNYLAELWGAATPDSLAPLQLVTKGGVRHIAPFGNNGYIISGESSLSVPSVPPFGWAWLQLRAWDARLGATYEEVATLNLGGYGESPIFYAQGDTPLAEPPRLPAPLIGLQSFNLRPIPEPSTAVLLALGGMCLWWIRPWQKIPAE
jgi:hypothetical protein